MGIEVWGEKRDGLFMTKSILLILASFYGFTAVILGAFGAHALKARLSPERLISFETGVRYQLIHAVVLLLIALLAARAPSAWLTASGRLIAIGVPLFSVSIYLLATRDLLGMPGLSRLGPVTPLGGLLMILGWLTLLVWSVRLP